MLQRPWLRFIRLAGYGAALWLVVETLLPPGDVDLLHMVGGALAFGLLLGAMLGYQGQASHREAIAALAELGPDQREQAIVAVTRGGIPADPAVQYATVRLGLAYLRNKRPAQLERQFKLAWIMLAVAVLALFALARPDFTARPDRLASYGAVALFGLVVAYRSMAATRRISTNVERIAGRLDILPG